MEQQERSETVFNRMNRRLNEFYIQFMVTVHGLKILVLDYIQKIVEKLKPVVVPCMHLCDAAIHVVCQILHGLNHNQYFVCIRDQMSFWCPNFLLSFKDSMVYFLRLTLAAIYLTLTGIFQHKVLPASGNELVERCQECFNKIKNVNVTRHSPLTLFSTEEIETMKQAEKNSKDLQKNLNITQAVGSTVGIVAAFVTFVGFVLTPVTFGASLGLSAVGVGLSVSGAAVSIGATVVNVNGKKRVRRNVDAIFLKYLKLLKAMGQLVKQYVQLTECLAKLASVQWSEQHESMGEKMQRLGHLREKVRRLELSFQVLPEKVEEILECMNILSNLVKEVTEEMHNHPDHRDVTITDEVDRTVEEAVEKILEYHRENPNLISDFILRYFGYKEDVERSVNPLQLGNGNILQGSLVGLQSASAMCIIFETMDIALELADDVFLTAAESLKVISKVGIVIGAIGMFIDIGVLTKTLIDLSKGSPEALSVHFRHWRLHMELINILPAAQRQREEIQFFAILIHPVCVLVITLLIYIAVT